jgi:hypothetical protein
MAQLATMAAPTSNPRRRDIVRLNVIGDSLDRAGTQLPPPAHDSAIAGREWQRAARGGAEG